MLGHLVAKEHKRFKKDSQMGKGHAVFDPKSPHQTPLRQNLPLSQERTGIFSDHALYSRLTV